MDAPIQYIRPPFFDWGVFKHNGWWILLATSNLYAATYIDSVWLFWRSGQAFRWPKITLTIGLFVLFPMVHQIVLSLEAQLTSAHHQESIHIPALETITISFGIALAIWIVSLGYRVVRGPLQ
jgi:hypothetical protein